jgi:hypothetical protein
MKLGTTDISSIKLGTTDVSKVYLGNSLMWEPAAGVTNLLSFTEDFTNAYWSRFGNVSSNAINSPIGTLTADGFRAPNVSTNEKSWAKSLTAMTGGQQYCFSVYAKPGAINWAYLVFFDSAGLYIRRYFDISTGALGNAENVTPTNPNQGITSVGDGWYRIFVSMTLNATRDITLRMQPAGSNGGKSYAAANTTDPQLYFWGAQLETGVNTPSTYTAN